MTRATTSLSGLVVLVCVACGDTSASDGQDPTGSESASTTSGTTDGESGPGDESGTNSTDTDTGDTGDTEGDCGNGILEADEECDDGNSTTSDGCTNACTLPFCGDGIVQVGEACDDANDIDDDMCTNACVLATCGNGVLDPGEECEDGDADPNDGCTNACLFASCGDGIVWTDYEACDDGNAVETDTCTSVCELAACGDGFVQPLEECEDGNQVGNDGCFDCLEQRVVALSTGAHHTCAQLDTGALRCWGASGGYAYGNTQTIGDDEYPFTAGDVDVGGSVVQMSAGVGHTCVLLRGGAVRCWGGPMGLGYGNFQKIGDDEPPGSGGDVNVGGPVTHVEVGRDHTCAIMVGGAVRCWGAGYAGQLGYGNTDDVGITNEPFEVGDVPVGGPVVQLALGGLHTCALLDQGNVRCWGRGNHGQLGYSSPVSVGDEELPEDWGDVNVGGVVVQIAAGEDHTCAVLETGTVRCWGRGQYGQLGYPGNFIPENIGDNETPASVGDVDVGGVVTAIALGTDHTCALLEAGTVRCWGWGEKGRLGYGNLVSVGTYIPPSAAGDVPVGGGLAVEQLTANLGSSTCVVLENGVVRCWGFGGAGRLGYANGNDIGDDELPVSAGNVQIF